MKFNKFVKWRVLSLRLFIEALSQNSKKIVFFSFVILLSACSDNAPRDKWYSFFYGSFYIKIVDQDGHPVEGAELDISHGYNSWLGSNRGLGKYLSDADGFVEVTVDSRRLSIDRIRATGYSIDLSKILHNFSKNRVSLGGNFYSWDYEKYSSKETPFILPAWRVDEPEKQAYCINGGIQQTMKADGRPYGIDFLRSQEDIIVEGDLESPLQITYSYDGTKVQLNQRRRNINELLNQEWRYSLRLTGAGIREISSKDVYIKRPTQSGYTESWSLDNRSFRAREDAYSGAKDEDNRHFYLKLNNMHYARVQIRFKPLGNTRLDFHNGIIFIDYSVNIDGSRYVRGIDTVATNQNSCVDAQRHSEKVSEYIYPE